MKKLCFIIGSIEIVLGLLSLMVVSLIKESIPKFAKMCFMLTTGSFLESSYIINTGFANTVSILICAMGVVTIVYSHFHKSEAIS